MIIRVGEGQTPSGKILDRGTHWYSYNKKGKNIIDEREYAIRYALETNRNIYISSGKKAYFKTTIERLRAL